MSPLDLVKLTALMERTSGRTELIIGLIDGPIALTRQSCRCAYSRDSRKISWHMRSSR